jgi:hypothetical protein
VSDNVLNKILLMKKTIRKQKAEKVNDVGRLRTTWRVNGNSADLISLDLLYIFFLVEDLLYFYFS